MPVGRYDRYILSQLIVVFGFFSFVLLSVYWVNEAVQLLDWLIGSGQAIGVVVEFTALSLPTLMLLVLPVAAFVATLYCFNRLIGESELVVFQTAGLGAVRLLRPVAWFGVILAGIMLILGNILAPAARGQLVDRSQAVQEDLTGAFLQEGQFLHPVGGLTIYIRDITELGEFRDIFLQDRSAPRTETTYTATRALLVRSEGGPRLVMFDGVAQTLEHDSGRLSVIRFADFTYDLGALVGDLDRRVIDPRELDTVTLLTADAALAEQINAPLARLVFLGHDRIARGLFGFFVPLIAAAVMLLGGFSRFGAWPQIIVAVAIIIPLQMLWNTSEAVAMRDPGLAWLAYAQPVAAALVTGVLVTLGMMGRILPPRGARGGAV